MQFPFNYLGSQVLSLILQSMSSFTSGQIKMLAVKLDIGPVFRARIFSSKFFRPKFLGDTLGSWTYVTFVPEYGHLQTKEQ